MNGPGRVVRVLELRSQRAVRRPCGMLIAPLDPTRGRRITVSIHRDVVTTCMQLSGEVRDEQFSTTIAPRRNFNEWRTNQRDSHSSADLQTIDVSWSRKFRAVGRRVCGVRLTVVGPALVAWRP